MKRILTLLVLSLVLVAGSFSLRAYESSPCTSKIVPECIWAAATGGGTWVTEIQITNATASPTGEISAAFLYTTGAYRYVTLTSSLAGYNTIKYPNILSAMDALDTGAFDYYGRVGAVWFEAHTAGTIQVTAKTVNGNYGKTFPGLCFDIPGTSAAQGRPMMIPSLTNNSTYRTFCGFFNTSGSVTYSASFFIYNYNLGLVGSSFSKTFQPWSFMSFNPFVEAGVGAGSYDNCWLYISCTGSTGNPGLMGFGSIANNNSNDPAALIPYQWGGTASAGEAIGTPTPRND